MSLDDKLRALIAAKALEEEIKRYAESAGMLSLKRTVSIRSRIR